jgi:hypothetical protein
MLNFKIVGTSLLMIGLAACGGGGDGGGGSSPLKLNNNISDLYGRILLNYNFTGGSRVYNDSAFYNSNSTVSNGLMVTYLDGSRTKAMACGMNPEYGSYAPYRFVCFISTGVTSGSEFFLFNIDSSWQISGLYEYCTNTDPTACARDLILTPDGMVRGSINKNATALDFDVSKYDSSDILNDKILKKSFGLPSSSAESANSPVGEAASELFKKIKF